MSLEAFPENLDPKPLQWPTIIDEGLCDGTMATFNPDRIVYNVVRSDLSVHSI